MTPIKFKNDNALLVFSGILVLTTFALVAHGDVTWKEGAAFIMGALALPGLFGRDDPPPPPPLPPSPPSSGATPFIIGLLCIAVFACGGAATRAEARGAVEVTAAAVKVGDETCGKHALERKDIVLARRCATAYEAARASLLTAAAGIDAWDEGKRDDVACAIVRAADEIARTVDELRTRELQVPKILEDSLRLVSALGGCHD